MSHSHHHHSHSLDVQGTKNISVAFFLNLSFTVVELIGGILTNSMAILSDAIHDLGDSLSLGLAWYFQTLSGKKGDKQYSYGYKRFSLLGAIINSFVLIIGSFVVLYESVPRLFHPEQPKVEGMFLLAIVGIVVNGAAVFRLKKGNSINEKVVSLHLLEDVLGWGAVLIGSVVMYFVNLPVIDPLLSLGISVYVLLNVFRNIRQTFRIILQAVPDEINLTGISEKIMQFPEIKNVHDLHIWSADGNYNVLTAHIVTDKLYEMQELAEMKAKLRDMLTDNGIQHATFEFETDTEQCNMEQCCS
jgi:cobalt-zinc-cadmium efflux system protein